MPATQRRLTLPPRAPAQAAADYTPALLAALQTVADTTAGVALVGYNADVRLDLCRLDPGVRGFGGERRRHSTTASTIVATLSNPTIVEGTAAISVPPPTSVDHHRYRRGGELQHRGEPGLRSAKRPRESVTFTITLTGFPLNAGNSATVDVAASGTGTSGGRLHAGAAGGAADGGGYDRGRGAGRLQR